METHNKELDELYSGTIPDIVEGSILKGKVISIKPDSVVVDIGYKSEGFISIEEFAERERGGLSEGSEIEVYVSKIDSDGLVILSPEKARRIRTLQRLEEAQKDGSPVEGVVVERIKGGYNVDIDGIRAFMPGSQADLKPLKDPDSLIGQAVQVRVLKFNSKLTNVIVSRRVLLEEERAKLREKTLANLKPDSIMPGVVKNITDYGVFVDLGGIDGLLHISDISWGRIRHPSDVFSIGQEIEVVVLSFAPDTEKVTLGYKQKRPDPWLNIEEKYPVGKVVSGKVVSLTDYGAFVEIEDGVEGLVHVSELDWSPRPKHPSNYMEIGDFVDAQILKVDPKERRVSLGIKQLKPKPWELVAERYEVGQRISGRVRSLTDFGAFIGLPEGVDALLHISDMSWTKHIRHPSEVLRKGQVIEAVILSLEPEKERMALGLKQLMPDPWQDKIPAEFHLGEEVKCKVLRHTEFGIFVELEGEVEGLVYSSEIDTGGKKPEEVYKEGDEIVVRIIKVDVEGRKIGLSLKTLKHETDV
ncbi:MAG: 30S ribosomal protein S1 [Nitrospirae bacterium]|nr:30S ribosomal protein S1 [Nitrospirota bacterium]